MLNRRLDGSTAGKRPLTGDPPGRLQEAVNGCFLDAGRVNEGFGRRAALERSGGRFGSVPPVRAGRKQSLAQRDRPAATRGQLYLVELPFGPALVAEPNVGSMPDTVSTPTGVDRLLTLRTLRSGKAGGAGTGSRSWTRLSRASWAVCTMCATEPPTGRRFRRSRGRMRMPCRPSWPGCSLQPGRWLAIEQVPIALPQFERSKSM
jgi:hypothetical protein